MTGWEVLRASISERNGGLTVEGINHENTNPLDRNFIWNIGRESLRDARFNFTGCMFGPGARERVVKLGVKL